VGVERRGRRRTGTGRARWARWAVTGALVTLTATACLRNDIDVTVDEEGAGELTFLVRFEPGFDDRSGIGNPRALEELADEAIDDIPGANAEQLRPADGDGVKVVIPFESVEDLSSAVTTVWPVAGQPVQLFRTFDVTRDGDDWSLRAVPDLSATDTLVNLLGARAAVVALGEPNTRLTVQLPGRVRSTNAPIFSGGSATWDLGRSGAPAELRLDTAPPDTGTPLLAVVGAGLGAVVVGILLMAVAAPAARKWREPRESRKARKAREATAAAAAAGWSPPNTAVREAPAHGAQPTWDSPPPYASHRPGEPVPGSGAAASPDGPAAASTAHGAGTAPVAGAGPAAGQVAPGATPVGTLQEPARAPEDPTVRRIGPPVLPEGFAPPAATAFPDSHPPGPPPGAADAEDPSPGRANIDPRDRSAGARGAPAPAGEEDAG
jgi:hypothetical protein